MPEAAPHVSRGEMFQLSLPCDLAAVRAATMSVRFFLAEHGLHEEELMSCELALAEACNNAIQYAQAADRQMPIEITASCDDTRIELRVKDHAPGFDWPENATLPDPEQESGRGVFLIQSVMDRTNYLRGRGENTLVMLKNRIYQGHHSAVPSQNSLLEATRKLAESQQTISDMARELCFRSESLSAIHRYSSVLGRVNDLGDFSRCLLDDLLHITAADWFVFRLIPPDESRLVVFASSETGGAMQPLAILGSGATTKSAEIKAALTRQDVGFDSPHPLDPTDPLAVLNPGASGFVRPVMWDETLVGTLAIGRRRGQPAFTAAQAKTVHTFAGFLALQVANTRFPETQDHGRGLTHELEMAKNIQRALLPKSLPRLRNLSIAGYCESARQVGGDFYDAILLSDQTLLLVVADVMGKGIPAAMFAATLHSLIRAIPEWMPQPSRLLARLNRLMFDQLSGVDMFITAQFALVDTEKQELTVANAGHCPVLLICNDGNSVRAVSPEGMPLGIVPTTTFRDETVKLGGNCRAIFYTDGITEARNERNELFGQERLQAWLRQSLTRGRTAEQLKEDFVSELIRFQGNAPLRDDRTFLVLAEEGERS